MMDKRLSGSFSFVAETEKKIVGFVNFSQVNSEGPVELSAIYLYPNYQVRGIGTALLQECIKNRKYKVNLY